MMIYIFFILWFLFFECQDHQESKHFSNYKNDSIVSDRSNKVNISNKSKDEFYSLLGMDSIALADYVFIDYQIDSISIKKIVFDAIYLECFKGNIHLDIYNYLKKIDAFDYKAIANSTTAHLLIVDGIEFAFDGKSNIRCFTKNTKVEVKATVYSFFSNKKGLGKFIILDSIREKREIIKNNVKIK